MENEEVINKDAIVAQMQSFLDLWERTNDIQYYYEYQKYFKQLKDEINKWCWNIKFFIPGWDIKLDYGAVSSI